MKYDEFGILELYEDIPYDSLEIIQPDHEIYNVSEAIWMRLDEVRDNEAYFGKTYKEINIDKDRKIRKKSW